jgi:hypothetical protein
MYFSASSRPQALRSRSTLDAGEMICTLVITANRPALRIMGWMSLYSMSSEGLDAHEISLLIIYYRPALWLRSAIEAFILIVSRIIVPDATRHAHTVAFGHTLPFSAELDAEPPREQLASSPGAHYSPLTPPARIRQRRGRHIATASYHELTSRRVLSRAHSERPTQRRRSKMHAPISHRATAIPSSEAK